MGLMLVSASGFAQTPPLTCPVGSVPSDIKAIGAFMVERPPAYIFCATIPGLYKNDTFVMAEATPTSPACNPGAICPVPAGYATTIPNGTNQGALRTRANQLVNIVQAPAGSYAQRDPMGRSTGGTAVVPCPIGYYSAAPGAISCTPAAPGSYVDTVGAKAATPCPPNSATPNTPGQSRCISNVGYYMSNNVVTACPAGSYSRAAGATSCIPADAGSFVATAGSYAQTPAAVGFYVPAAGATAPLACPANSTTTTTGQTSCLAKPGFYIANNALNPCPAGSYSATVGATTCTPATRGAYVAMAGSSAQTPASVGSYVPTAGATGQQTCPPNTTNTGTGQTSCVAIKKVCPAGSENVWPDCVASVGMYGLPNMNRPYSSCPKGTWNDQKNKWYITDCIPASVGYYAAGPGSVGQVKCRTGSTTTKTGADTCVTMPGYFKQDMFNNVQPCPIGSYSNTMGATQCTKASPNFYVDKPASTEQTRCWGNSTSKAGAYNCDAAPYKK
jgi:hypothetical protein